MARQRAGIAKHHRACRDLFPLRIGEIRPAGATGQRRGSFKTLFKRNGDNPSEVLTEEDMRLREKANIEAALTQTGWKIYGTGGAAELLGLKPTTLLSRIKKMGIEKTH